MAAAVIATSALINSAAEPARDQDRGVRPVVLVLQRNNRLSVFDAQTLTLLGSFATGALGDGLSVRPDGRVVYLLQALTQEPRGCCSLQTLDLETRRLCEVRQYANVEDLPRQTFVMAPAVSGLASLPRRDGSSFRPIVQAAGDLFVAFERMGVGLHQRPDGDKQPPVGAFLIDGKTGVVVRHILPDVFFRDLVASPNGRFLYGIEDWPRGDPVRFMRIDAGTGAVLAERTLHPTKGPGTLVEEWSLAYAAVPSELVPRGEVATLPCRR